MEQRTEQAHDIFPRSTIFQLLPLRIEQLLGDPAHLARVVSELPHPRIVGVIVQPYDQPWEILHDRREKKEQPRGVPEGRKTNEQTISVVLGPGMTEIGGRTLDPCMISSTDYPNRLRRRSRSRKLQRRSFER